MIKTHYINSVTVTPKKLENFNTINVLKWNNSKWKTLCPYYMETDNGILFENFYQGSKVYDIVYSNDVYASQYHMNNPKYLWWSYKTVNKDGDILIDNENKINYELYYKWRDSLWKCKKPVRYPNKIFNKNRCKFSLCKDENGNEKRLNYLESRKELYVKEYIKIVKKTKEYTLLLDMLKNGENLLICEIDVPATFKNGNYGKDCDENNNCLMSLEKINELLNDETCPFGHGLALAYSLLIDLSIKKEES